MTVRAAVAASGLTKRYGDVVAVESLSFTVPAGTFFGFLGPNGSGKSTTIGCLTGLLDPTAGSVCLLEEPFGPDAIGLKRRIGVMPENLGLFDYLYAHEFLTFQAQMYGLDKATTRARIEELLEALSLSDEGRKPMGEFSAGMRKRIAFAAAIIHAPEILFLDEPFESIDPAGVALMKQWLRRFVAQGRTVFLTTHVLDAVERLCDRVMIIKTQGQVVWEGDITPLAANGTIAAGGQRFDTLEALFLHLTGERYKTLDWL
jgi:ABC-2 type transport system ATP-binding protein